MKVWKKIGVNVLVRASAKGGSGIYLYMPRDHADAYGIVSGKKVEIRLIRVEEEIPDKKPDALDLTEAKVGKRRRKHGSPTQGSPKY